MVPYAQPPAIIRLSETTPVQGFMLVPPPGGHAGAYLVEPRGFPAQGRPGSLLPAGPDEGAPVDGPAASPPPVQRRPSRPGWVLVIPAASQSGSKATWGPADPWSSQWTAPVRVGGMRVVATMGDADDHDRMTGLMLADPDSPATASAAASLARKYGAPSVALVLQRGGASEIRLWKSGSMDSLVADAGASKAEALEALAGLAIPGRDTPGADTPAAAEQPVPGADAGDRPVDVEDHPEDATGNRMGFAVVLDTGDKSKSDSLRKKVASVPGISVTRAVPDQDGIEIRGTWEGDMDTLVHALEAAGVRVAR